MIQTLLQPMKNLFYQKFSKTIQLLLDNYLGDYLQDPAQLQLENLFNGVQNLQLNKKFINDVLGFGVLKLEEAYIEFLKVNNMKLEAKGITLVFALADEVNKEAYLAYLDEASFIQLREANKLQQLGDLQKEIYKRNDFEQSQELNRSMNQYNQMSHFFDLVEMLFGNSSLVLSEINVVLRWKDGESKLHFDRINVDLQKPTKEVDSNGAKLYFKCKINTLQMLLNGQVLARSTETLALSAYLQMLDRKVHPKVEVKASVMNMIFDKHHLKVVSVLIDKYTTLAQSLEQFRKEYESVDDFSINESISAQKEELQSRYQLGVHKMPNYMDLEKSVMHDAQLDQVFEQEYTQSVFRTEEPKEAQQLRNQAETLKVKFSGFKIALCEQSNAQFTDSKFFHSLDDHYYLRIKDVDFTLLQMKANIKIKRVLCMQIIALEPIFHSAIQNSQDFFQSCREQITKHSKVHPILLMGAKMKPVYIINGYSYQVEKIPSQCQSKEAMHLNVQIYDGKNNNHYHIMGNISDIVVSTNMQQIASLFKYMPNSNNTEVVPPRPSNISFEISIPLIRGYFNALNKDSTIILQQLQVQSKPTTIIATKQGNLYPYEAQPQDESPVVFMMASFKYLKSTFEGATILYVGEDQIKDHTILPLIVYSQHIPTKVHGARLQNLDEYININKKRSTSLIRAQIPLVTIDLSMDFILWIQKLTTSQQPSQPPQQQPITTYSQLIVDKTVITMYDSQSEIIKTEITKLILIDSKHQIVLLDDITIIDPNFFAPLFKRNPIEQQYQCKDPAQILLYKTFMKQAMPKFGNNKVNYVQPLQLLDTHSYVIKIIIDEVPYIQIKNLCFRLHDFSLSLLYKLQILLLKLPQQNQQVEQQQQAIELNIKGVYIDIYPYYQQHTYSKSGGLEDILMYSWTRSLIEIQEVSYKNDVVTVQQLQIYAARSPGIEIFSPVLLVNMFDRKEAFQFRTALILQDISYAKNVLSSKQMSISLKLDVIETITEHLQNISDILKLPPTTTVPATQQAFKLSGLLYTKEQLLKTSLIGKKPLNIFQVRIDSIVINLQKGYSYAESPIDFDVDTFEESLESHLSTYQYIGYREDGINVVLNDFCLQIDIHEQATGVKLITDLQIVDNIRGSKFALILGTEDTTMDALTLAFILEEKALTVGGRIAPIRICVSGHFLEFLMEVQRQNSLISRPCFSDEIIVIEQHEQQLTSIFTLKGLELHETFFIVTYDSVGINLNGMLKGFLRVSSFRNMELRLSSLSVAKQGDIEEVSGFVAEKIVDAFGSQLNLACSALSSMQAISIVSSLTLGLKSLIVKPFREGFVNGSLNGMSDFSKALTSSLLKVVTMPSKTLQSMGDSLGLQQLTQPLQFINSQSKKLISHMNPSDIPKRFLKKYNQL